MKVLFAPDHTPELEIMKQMLKGASEVVFAIFTFAGSSGIDDTMVALARGGMTIRGVLDRGQASHDWAAPKTMKPPIELFVPKATGDFADLRKLHHRVMVIDERVVVAGSFNYTQPANEFNDEKIFVLGSVFPKTPEGHAVDAARCKVLAKHVKAEIERIIANSKTYVP